MPAPVPHSYSDAVLEEKIAERASLPPQSSSLVIIKIDPAVHLRNKNLTNKCVEYGGTLEWADDRRHFGHKTLTSGKYNSVAIPKGQIQFHTHPNKCTDEVCAMGIPSIHDLFGYADAVVRGETDVHCIYSKDGVYCMMLRPEIKRAMKDKRFRRIWRDTAESNLARFRGKHDVTEDTYDDFKTSWINLARGQGFEIDHQPRNSRSSQFQFEADSMDNDRLSYTDYISRHGGRPEPRVMNAMSHATTYHADMMQKSGQPPPLIFSEWFLQQMDTSETTPAPVPRTRDIRFFPESMSECTAYGNNAYI
jgi:hypothetical protein